MNMDRCALRSLRTGRTTRPEFRQDPVRFPGQGFIPLSHARAPRTPMRFVCRARTTLIHRFNIRRRLFKYRNNRKQKQQHAEFNEIAFKQKIIEFD
ncbi:hypothetical protein [Burkholderia sp. LMG 32019]|uniref:hypothetical protein n=1 Tax=Burkholderia sp. LMG 32019 TaxID=3158173 RepID=UPI003C2F0432